MLGGPEIPAYKLFSEAELGLALGGINVIHAAVLAGDAGRAALKRIVALDRYRGGTPDDQATFAAVADDETGRRGYGMSDTKTGDDKTLSVNTEEDA